MSWMASRIACRAVRRLGDDGLIVSRVMSPFKCLSTANNAGNAPATLLKAPEPQIVDALVAQTHTSAVLVPPQQVDGTKVVVKVPEEYPCELLAPAEPPKKNELELPKREVLGLPKREGGIDVSKAAETERLSSALPNLDMKERQAHSNSHEARKDSVDKKETAKFAAIAATWYVHLNSV